jgi:malonate transporter and related proteins
MEAIAGNTLRLGLLCVPVLLGLLAARLRLIPETPDARAALNTFALYFGFPALVLSSLLDARFELPGAVAFWLAIPVAQGLLVAALYVGARVLGLAAQAGTAALVALFGNVAFLGLPFVIEVLGEASRGLAALAVSIHVALAVAIGPIVLRRWSGAEGAGAPRGSVLRQPLLWAPIVGLAGRAFPEPARALLEAVATPTGATAAPVALFVLGLYLYAERRTLLDAERGTAFHVWVRIGLAPVCTGVVVIVFSRAGWITHDQGAVFLILAGMPAAVTTFSMAHDAHVGTRRVAATIVRSSVVSLVTLPLLATAAHWL